MKSKVEYYRAVHHSLNYWLYVETGKALNNKNVLGFSAVMVKGFDLAEYKHCWSKEFRSILKHAPSSEL